MPSIELTDEQALNLWEQLPEEQKKRVIAQTEQNGSKPIKQRRFSHIPREAASPVLRLVVRTWAIRRCRVP